MAPVSAKYEQFVTFLEEMVSIPSVSGDEGTLCDFVCERFQQWGWPVERQLVAGNRYNIYCGFGIPRILFTTHLDVVPAPRSMFTPRHVGDRLSGRGACDAKGIATAMIAACSELVQSGRKDFALLLVVGEERDGIGAQVAAAALKDHGVRHLINGEPTERKMILAHKGMLRFRVDFVGRSGHSGYPEEAEDANAKLIRFSNKLLELDLGIDSVLGKATINVGIVNGGVACNVISSSAHLECVVRLVGPPEAALGTIRSLLGQEGCISEISAVPPAHMSSLIGFETDIVSYSTDIPNFFPLGAKTYLFGPGSIHVAHTEDEYIDLQELEASIHDYVKIYQALC